MKVKKTIWAFLFLVVGILGSQACDEGCDDTICDCGELDGISPYYDINGISSYSSGFFNEDGNWVLINAGEADLEIPADQYGIEATFTAEFYGADLQPELVQTGTKGGFLSAAYACTPPGPGYLGSLERVTNIEITSSMDFDEFHPAGSSLSNLFYIYPFVPDQRQNIQSVFFLNEFISAQQAGLRSFTLLLNAIPENPVQKFNVTYTLDFNEVYEMQLDSVTIVPPQ